MAIDSTTPRTRRAVLFGALAASAASVVGRAMPVQAANTDTVHVGDTLTGSSTTSIDLGANAGPALSGTATTIGIQGFGDTAVWGESDSVNGVFGHSSGVSGYNGGVSGIAESPTGVGIWGQAPGNGSGAMGISGVDTTTGAPAKTGVFGMANQDASSVGVSGTSSHGRGGKFKGGAAQIRLIPSSAATHPASGAKGDLFVDTAGRLWFCKGATKWKQLA